MFPSLQAVKAACEVSPPEERLLRSPEAPIVLLRRLRPPPGSAGIAPVADSVAPANPNLGVLLPYTPLHHLLMARFGLPVVATSGNSSDEPICTDEREALERLGGIAELFLVHNRPIVRHVDDSIARIIAGRELVLRRARGYAPLPILLSAGGGVRSADSAGAAAEESPGPAVLGVGAHLKNTIALAVGPQVFISQHIGDLETDQAFEAFRRVIADFERLYETAPAIIAADAHPDYLSTKYARELVEKASLPAISRTGSDPQSPSFPSQPVSIQHHVAHVFACMAENELQPPVLGVSWDGTGYGLDATVWGGEFFLVTDEQREPPVLAATRSGARASASPEVRVEQFLPVSETFCQRVAHLRPFPLPGADKAIKEPRRTGLGLLYELFGEAAFGMSDLAPVQAFARHELTSLKTMLHRRLNSPLTSSVGRLFDAVAAITGLRQAVRFEGQAAMELEFALADIKTSDHYPVPIAGQRVPEANRSLPAQEPALILDWHPMIEAILSDVRNRASLAEISVKFHNALVETIIAVARYTSQERVLLTGGCFQNRYLTERAIQRLQEEGRRPYWHQRVPPNDGGISLGQVMALLSHYRA